MQIQQVNRSDAERVWVNITNVDGKTITTHYPVYLMTNNKNSSTGATQGLLGPVVALDTVTATLHSLGSINYVDHVFLRSV